MGRNRCGSLMVVAALWVAIGVTGVAERAASAGNLDEAKAAFAAGKAAYERGDYDAALVQFQRANLIQPAPSLSFNIGMTYERVGRNRDAVAAFERYLTLTGAPQNPQEQQFQDNLKTRIAGLRARPDSAPGPRQPQQQPQPEIQPPPPQNPQYNYYYQQPQQAPGQPYYYGQQPQFVYQNPVLTPQQRLENAKKRRSSGIGLLVSGLIIDVIGISMIGIEVAANGRYFWLVGGFGVVFTLTGTVLWPIGVALIVKGNKEIDEAARAVPPQALAIPDGPRQASLEPATFLFHLPAVRF